MKFLNQFQFKCVTVLVVFTIIVNRIDGQAIINKQTNDWDLIARQFTPFSDTNSDNEANSTTSTAKPFAEVPKSTMDIITVIWYLSTFLALAAFFFLMVCSDRRCGRSRVDQTPQQAPPTPAPSYSEFAPPSYDAVMNQTHPKVYLVPIHQKLPDKKNIDISFHTVNELQKIS